MKKIGVVITAGSERGHKVINALQNMRRIEILGVYIPGGGKVQNTSRPR